MKFNEVEQTYVCQFNKPENQEMLKGYVARQDKSGAELAKFYMDVVNALAGTPAWGVAGVNKMLNKLTATVRATLNKEKRGKSSAPAQARTLLSDVAYWAEKEATPKYNRCKLDTLLTAEELVRLATI